MKHVEVDEDLHDLIKLYCWYNQVKVKDFVNSKLKSLPELQSLEKKRKTMRFS